MAEQFVFSDLRELFAKANEEKSGDQLAGIAARSESERVAAKRKLADLTLAEIVQQPLIDPDMDDVSRLILETFDQEAFQPIKSLTVGEFREYILDDATDEAAAEADAVGHHSGNCSGCRQDHEQQGSGPGRGQNPECDALPEHDG